MMTLGYADPRKLDKLLLSVLEIGICSLLSVCSVALNPWSRRYKQKNGKLTYIFTTPCNKGKHRRDFEFHPKLKQ